MSKVVEELRLAVRQMYRKPGFTLTVLFTLALSIGANTAIFSITNALLLRPLPYPHPDRLATMVRNYEGKQSGQDLQAIDGETFELLHDRVSAVTAAVSGMASGVNLQSGSSVQYVRQERVSARFFEVLGIQPLMGRSFTEAEDWKGGPNLAVLKYELWANSFGRDAKILGRAIELKGESYTVIGVLPKGAQTKDRGDVFTPLHPSREGEGGGENYDPVIRLKDGATWEQAKTQLSQVRPQSFASLEKGEPGMHVTFDFLPLQAGQTYEERKPVLVLMLAVSFILLIACANLAGLMLVRVTERTSEIATRLALGASRWHILRQLWIENLALALLGGMLGIGTAWLALDGLKVIVPKDYFPQNGIPLDVHVLAFAFGISVCTSFLFGMLPAWIAGRVDIRGSMAASGSRSVAQHGNRKLRQALIAAEVALTVVLLAASGLLIRTLIWLETMPSGFNPSNVMTAKLSLDDSRYRDRVAFAKLLDESVLAMKRIPGVTHAAVGLSLPYERGLNNGFEIADGPQAGKGEVTSLIYLTPEYFDTLRIPLLRGRAFSASDNENSQPVAILNESFARRYFGNTDPIGHHVKTNSGAKDAALVIGVVRDVAKKPGLEEASPIALERTVYIPAAQTSAHFLAMVHVWFQPSWIVETSGPVDGLTAAMQRALSSVDPRLPFSGFYRMSDLRDEAVSMQRIEVTLLSSLAFLALLLSGVGIWSLIASLVAHRTREIGIRIALGSTVRQAIIEVGNAGIYAAAAGVAIGLGLCTITLRLLKSALYGVQSYDPLTLVSVVVLLAAVSLLGTFLPAMRIARIDPAITLREE